jgi:NitT/TauT family transport system substrate-binding protein
MKVDDKVLNLSLKWISYDDLKLDQNSYTQLVNYLTEMKLGKGLPTYQEFVDPSLLNKTKSDEAK